MQRCCYQIPLAGGLGGLREMWSSKLRPLLSTRLSNPLPPRLLVLGEKTGAACATGGAVPGDHPTTEFDPPAEETEIFPGLKPEAVNRPCEFVNVRTTRLLPWRIVTSELARGLPPVPRIWPLNVPFRPSETWPAALASAEIAANIPATATNNAIVRNPFRLIKNSLEICTVVRWLRRGRGRNLSEFAGRGKSAFS